MLLFSWFLAVRGVAPSRGRAVKNDTASMTDTPPDSALTSAGVPSPGQPLQSTGAAPHLRTRPRVVRRRARLGTPPRVWRVPEADASTVRVRAPAKVNLHLGVGPLRPDGYHDLVTVFHAVDLTDEIVARPADRLEICVAGEGSADLPTDEGNLAWRAAALLAEHAGVAPRVRLEITKSIPVAGGMAGGSADAAAALVACAALWGTGTPRTVLAELAARLGSDVAFPLFGGTALGTGRGEVLTPVTDPRGRSTGCSPWPITASRPVTPTANSTGSARRDRRPGRSARRTGDRRAARGRSAPAGPRPGQRPAGRPRWRWRPP